MVACRRSHPPARSCVVVVRRCARRAGCSGRSGSGVPAALPSLCIKREGRSALSLFDGGVTPYSRFLPLRSLGPRRPSRTSSSRMTMSLGSRTHTSRLTSTSAASTRLCRIFCLPEVSGNEARSVGIPCYDDGAAAPAGGAKVDLGLAVLSMGFACCFWCRRFTGKY